MVKYPVGKPSITQAEIDSVVATLCAGKLTQGEGVEQFEKEFGEFIGARHVVACSSGTAALHLSLVALGIGPRDEVLVPDLTYVATVNAITYVGATPVLVDIDPNTWCIDLRDAEQKVTRRTRAILPVHLYGTVCNMDEISAFARGYPTMYVVEDAAEAIGGNWQGASCGTLGTCGAFSFYANKVITTGEGGAIVTQDSGLAKELRFLRGQAQSPMRRFLHTAIGYNYRLTDIQAAIGSAQLQRISCLLKERRRVIANYHSEFQGLLFEPHRSCYAAPWLYTGLLPIPKSPFDIEQELLEVGIETRPIFIPMHRLDMYRMHDRGFPVSTIVAERGISFPTYPELTSNDIAFICGEVKRVLQ